MTGNDARKMTGEEITAELKRLRASSFALRTQKITDKVDDHTKFRTTRRDIARLLTEQSSRTRAEQAKHAGKGAKGGRAAPVGPQRQTTREGRKTARAEAAAATTGAGAGGAATGGAAKGGAANGGAATGKAAGKSTRGRKKAVSKPISKTKKAAHA